MAMYMKLETTAVMILAGGRATRLGGICKNTPKSMLKVGDYPFLTYLVTGYIKKRLKPVIILAGHLGEVITQYFSQTAWEKLPVYINHLKNDDGEYGTGSRIINGVNSVKADNILVVNGDTVLDISIPNLLEQHQAYNSACTVVLTRLSDVPNFGAFLVGVNNRVLFSREGEALEDFQEPDKKQIAWMGSSTGAILFRKELLQGLPFIHKQSLEKHLLPSLIKQGKVRAFDNGEKTFFDFGKLERLPYLQTRADEIISIYGTPNL